MRNPVLACVAFGIIKAVFAGGHNSLSPGGGHCAGKMPDGIRGVLWPWCRIAASMSGATLRPRQLTDKAQGDLFMLSVHRSYFIAALMAVALLVLSPALSADDKAKIDAGTREALERLRSHSEKAGELVDKAAGVLVFPDVVKMGFGVGGQYGEGSLLVKDMPTSYFVTAGASFGLQVGAQVKSEVILFMTQEALSKFQNSSGWRVGVDGSVALVKLGAGGSMDTAKINQPVVGFIFSNKGLMYNLTMEGTKITRIAR
jgi:lipid-binding SYLF domain-containing protein